jgi:hypothetical protein
MRASVGANLGSHQAFGLVANRCIAAAAECPRSIRQGGQCKRLGLTWDRFCAERAELMVLLEESERQIGALSQEVRRKTVVVEQPKRRLSPFR